MFHPMASRQGLTPRNSVVAGNALSPNSSNSADNDTDFLPPMADDGNHYPATSSQAAWNSLFNVIRPSPQPYSDALGLGSSFLTAPWVASWEDDLIMTGVRSFDIKILDNSLGDYVDLGWGDDCAHDVNGSYYYAQNTSVAPIPARQPLDGLQRR